MLVEVVDDRRVAPPGDRNEEVVDQAQSRDGRCGAEQCPDERHELFATQYERAPEEVGADRDQIVLQREPDRRAVGGAAKPVLRKDRVDADEQPEGDGEQVGRMKAEGQPPLAQDLERDPCEDHPQEDLLPGLDGGQSAPAHPGPVERGHDRVVRSQTDDPRVQGQGRPSPDQDRSGHEQESVDREREPRSHQASLNRRRRSGLRPVISAS